MTATGDAAGARGLGSSLFRLAWLAVLTLAVLVSVAGAALTNRYYADVFDPFVSHGLRWSFGGPTVSLTRPMDLNGGLADIRSGDVIISVNGKPVPIAGARIIGLTHELKVAEGPVLRIRTRSVDGAVREHEIVPEPGAAGPADQDLASGRT
jgi:hypothetical protein